VLCIGSKILSNGGGGALCHSPFEMSDNAARAKKVWYGSVESKVDREKPPNCESWQSRIDVTNAEGHNRPSGTDTPSIEREATTHQE